jgi:proteasome lid subunit RPN8/RPN11
MAPASISVPQEVLDEIVEHAREDLPNECCGVLTGTDNDIKALERTENEFASPMSYRISSEEIFRAYKAASERGEDIVGFYHSHVRSQAYPSQTDLNEASEWPESLHLICSLEHRDDPAIRAFRLHGTEIEEVGIDGKRG